jgi:hypothetical protein
MPRDWRDLAVLRMDQLGLEGGRQVARVSLDARTGGEWHAENHDLDRVQTRAASALAGQISITLAERLGVRRS